MYVYIYISGIFWNPVPEDCSGIWMVKDIAGSRGFVLGGCFRSIVFLKCETESPRTRRALRNYALPCWLWQQIGMRWSWLELFPEELWGPCLEIYQKRKNTRKSYSIQPPKKISWKVRFHNFISKTGVESSNGPCLVRDFSCFWRSCPFFEGDFLFDLSWNHEPVNTMDSLKCRSLNFWKSWKTTHESQKNVTERNLLLDIDRYCNIYIYINILHFVFSWTHHTWTKRPILLRRFWNLI